MSSVNQAVAPSPAAVDKRRPTVHVQQLSWVLAWAVVFCDIGTSVYYVPGILYEQVGEYAPLFVGMVTIGFVLLAFKYVEISWRNPEGGGVVTVASKAFSPRWGALGGMLITVDYFLTSSISATSAFYYVGSVLPFFEDHVVAFACLGILFLASLNVVGLCGLPPGAQGKSASAAPGTPPTRAMWPRCIFRTARRSRPTTFPSSSRESPSVPPRSSSPTTTT